MIGPGTVISLYEIERQMGETLLAWTFRATKKDGKDGGEAVIIRVFRDERWARGEDWKKLGTSSDLPLNTLMSSNPKNLVRPSGVSMDVIDEKPHAFVVREQVEGKSLREKIAAGPLPLDEVKEIAREACEGLRLLHKVNFVHGGICPENIFRTDKGVVRLTDFGISLTALEEELTEENVGNRRWAYVAPEQRSPSTNCPTPAADIYSLGAVLCELLTGKPPVDDLANVGPVLQEALQAEPGNRYQNVEEFQEAISRLTVGAGSGEDQGGSDEGGSGTGTSQDGKDDLVPIEYAIAIVEGSRIECELEVGGKTKKQFRVENQGSQPIKIQAAVEESDRGWLKVTLDSAMLDVSTEKAFDLDSAMLDVSTEKAFDVEIIGNDREGSKEGKIWVKSDSLRPEEYKEVVVKANFKAEPPPLPVLAVTLVEPLDFGDIPVKKKKKGISLGARAREFQVKNVGGGTLKGKIKPSVQWIDATPPSDFEVGSRSQATITVEIKYDGKSSGEKRETIRIETNGGEQEVPVNVNFVVEMPKEAWIIWLKRHWKPVVGIALFLIVAAAEVTIYRSYTKPTGPTIENLKEALLNKNQHVLDQYASKGDFNYSRWKSNTIVSYDLKVKNDFHRLLNLSNIKIEGQSAPGDKSPWVKTSGWKDKWNIKYFTLAEVKGVREWNGLYYDQECLDPDEIRRMVKTELDNNNLGNLSVNVDPNCNVKLSGSTKNDNERNLANQLAKNLVEMASVIDAIEIIKYPTVNILSSSVNPEIVRPGETVNLDIRYSISNANRGSRVNIKETHEVRFGGNLLGNPIKKEFDGGAGTWTNTFRFPLHAKFEEGIYSISTILETQGGQDRSVATFRVVKQDFSGHSGPKKGGNEKASDFEKLFEESQEEGRKGWKQRKAK